MKNNSEWLKVVGAAVFEVMWVIGLKHAATMWEWLITVVAIIISFYVMISASTKLPVGTVYSVFVGLGTAGTVVADMVLFGEPFKLMKLVLVVILLAGVIGLKMVTKEAEVKGAS
ncbi:DMT family transporter [Paenibacillus pseudetheri]|uniref:Guanidinium efflux system subunit GdnC n=1 Tax=Paenibacillus pseudetheri TaxID=2897682 RepID=A0ABM9BJ06_9BACL|nr:multidrug efflux SMR transporter [Paenibacillus pseudetheri]CAH1058425.1 putative guanidinium efflux system subunit GdnC [Paenibacillus pseudetheri]